MSKIIIKSEKKKTLEGVREKKVLYQWLRVVSQVFFFNIYIHIMMVF